MSNLYLVLKFVHILSATVLFGAGLGTAFQMWTAHRSGDVRAIATVARHVVWADFLFTTPAIIVQPASGIALILLGGFGAAEPWLVAAYTLYALAGACWLPVVWIQLKVYRLTRTNEALPPQYFRLMRTWFWLGWPAFLAVLLTFWLMIAKPALW
ncbi:MAG TPA: DUF2269 domain-containing protein [Rhizomicrobium sp.]|jgi:uncharacterized membrane protein